jgi:hypothetical protein
MPNHFDEALKARAADAIPDRGDFDWNDVRRRARRRRSRGVLTVSVAAVLAVAASAPAFGLHRVVVGFFEAEPAPQRIQVSFDQFGIGAPPRMDPRIIPNSARRVLVERSEGPPAVLYLAPTRTGGFCYQWREWTGSCRADRDSPGGRAEPGDLHSYLLGIGWEPDTKGVLLKVAGNLIADDAERLLVEFADGLQAEIPVTWVSKPINAGFFLYEVPDRHRVPGHHVTALVAADSEGKTLARKSFQLIPPGDRERPAKLPNGELVPLPANAMPERARLLVDFEGFRGDRVQLWLIPRTDGRSCYQYNRGGGCPPRGWTQDVPMSSGISGGGPSILFFAQVVPDIAVVELRYEDDTRERRRPVEGFVLHEVPPRQYAKGHRLIEVIGRSSAGELVARQTYDPGNPGVYPCEKPVALGRGVTACP